MEELLDDYREAHYSNKYINHILELPYLFEGRTFKSISTKINIIDRLHTFEARTGIQREAMAIPSGLYAINSPGHRSPVIVTGNYKLTIDKVRKSLDCVDAWLLVLDTKGVNVWCAAGKGSFSTKELVGKIIGLNLEKIIKGRKLILPQLGASSMEPHIVKRLTKFKVIYGPVRACDIPKFLENDLKADGEMRKVTFTMGERMPLVHIEFIRSLRHVALATLFFWIAMMRIDFPILLAMVTASFYGNYIFVSLLPVKPFKSFALSGIVMGLPLIGISVVALRAYSLSWPFVIGGAAIQCALIIWYSFNFTGSTTFTSLSGVKVEGKYAFTSTFVLVFIGLIMGFVGYLSR